VHAFDVLGDPIRRRILELLGQGEAAAGDLTRSIQDEFGISQPGVSQHLKVLRESGFVTVRAAGTRRLYATSYERFDEVDAWMDRVRAFWTPKLDALDLEVRRGLSRKETP
jgi:DNA-binding transcriptional ArsR family regulator